MESPYSSTAYGHLRKPMEHDRSSAFKQTGRRACSKARTCPGPCMSNPLRDGSIVSGASTASFPIRARESGLGSVCRVTRISMRKRIPCQREPYLVQTTYVSRCNRFFSLPQEGQHVYFSQEDRAPRGCFCPAQGFRVVVSTPPATLYLRYFWLRPNTQDGLRTLSAPCPAEPIFFSENSTESM